MYRIAVHLVATIFRLILYYMLKVYVYIPTYIVVYVCCILDYVYIYGCSCIKTNKQTKEAAVCMSLSPGAPVQLHLLHIYMFYDSVFSFNSKTDIIC